MAKLREVINELNKVINSKELTTIAGDENELLNSEVVTDEDFKTVKSQIGGLLTFDSAVNNQKVIESIQPKIEQKVENRLKAEWAGKQEARLATIGKELGLDLEGKYLKDQIDILENNIPSFKGQKVDTTHYTKEIERLNQENGQFKSQLEEVTTKAQQELKKFKIDSIIENKINSVNFAKSYQEPLVKKGLVNQLKSEIYSMAHVDLNENNELVIKNKENPDLDLYSETNQKLGIDDIINPKLEPFKENVKKRENNYVAPSEIKKPISNNNPNSSWELMQQAKQRA